MKNEEMSYKTKKQKKDRLYQLKWSIGLIKTVLLKKATLWMPRKETTVYAPVRTIMERLRLFAKGAKEKNKKIDQWVDEYVTACLLEAKPVVLLTQWCMSLDFEARYKKQGNRFIPTQQECDLVCREIPRILALFDANGLKVSWWITFNRSYLDSGRMRKEVERAYKAMVQTLFDQAGLGGRIMLLDWEDDVLMTRPKPNRRVWENVQGFLDQKALNIVFRQHANWAREEAGLKQSDEELWRDLIFQIACEAQEGFDLCDPEASPFEGGKFILVPLEAAERYDPTFLLLNKDFSKRIASIIKPYPWRLQ